MNRPVVPDPPQQPGQRTTNDDANREESAIGSGVYENERNAGRVNELRRRENMREALSTVAVFVAKATPYVLVIIALIMGWHYLGPEKWAWMTPTQIDRVETAVAGGAISLVALLLRRYLE